MADSFFFLPAVEDVSFRDLLPANSVGEQIILAP